MLQYQCDARAFDAAMLSILQRFHAATRPCQSLPTRLIAAIAGEPRQRCNAATPTQRFDAKTEQGRHGKTKKGRCCLFRSQETKGQDSSGGTKDGSWEEEWRCCERCDVQQQQQQQQQQEGDEKRNNQTSRLYQYKLLCRWWHNNNRARADSSSKEERSKTVTTTLPRTLEQALRLDDPTVQYVLGIDEAGRGPLAGPVVAAAICFPKNIGISGSDDNPCQRV